MVTERPANGIDGLLIQRIFAGYAANAVGAKKFSHTQPSVHSTEGKSFAAESAETAEFRIFCFDLCASLRPLRLVLLGLFYLCQKASTGHTRGNPITC